MVKLIALLLICCGISAHPYLREADYGPEFVALSRTMHDTCTKKYNTINQIAIDSLKSGVFPDDPNMKDYIFCLWLESGAMTKDGTMQIVRLKNILPPKFLLDHGMEMYTDCYKKSEGPSIPDKIYEMMKCVYKTHPQDFIMM